MCYCPLSPPFLPLPPSPSLFPPLPFSLSLSPPLSLPPLPLLSLSFGTSQVSVSKYVGSICELLGDANAQVRSVAMETLVEIYRHVGIKVRIDITKRNSLPTAKLQMIIQKFDELDGENRDEVTTSLSFTRCTHVPVLCTCEIMFKSLEWFCLLLLFKCFS